MKKTLCINLGGRPFVIDEDAYSTMSHYLRQIEMRHARAEDMSQIETRLANMLSETGVVIIDIVTLRSVMERFGTPDQFGTLKSESSNTTSDESPKRLYRSRTDKVVGGVCSGLAEYLGVDPVMVRVIALISLLMFASGAIAYLILWIAMPNQPLTK